MNRFIITLLCFLGHYAFLAQNYNASISGKIANNFADKVILLSNDGESTEFKIDKNNEFKGFLNVREGVYKMTIGNEYTNVYLRPFSSLNFTIDLNYFDQSVSYTGDIAYENNALAKLMLIDQEFQSRFQEIYRLSEDSFLAEQLSFTKKKNEILNNQRLSESFKNNEIIKAKMGQYQNLFDYPSYHKRFRKLNSFKPSASFYNFVSNIDLDNESAFEGNNIYIISDYLNYQVNKGSDTPIYLSDIEELAALKKWIKNQKLKDRYIEVSYKNNIVHAENPSELADAYLTVISDSKLAEDLKQFSSQFDKLSKGKPAPPFKLINEKGQYKSLSDYLGSYVYLDVWATWCGPCRVELPYYDSLKNEYKDKNIKFVSICVWDKEDKWKSFLKEKKLSGEQLFIAGEESQFVLDYMIRGVPSFILIDKNGKIMDRKAFRPSDKSAREKLNELLKN